MLRFPDRKIAIENRLFEVIYTGVIYTGGGVDTHPLEAIVQ